MIGWLTTAICSLLFSQVELDQSDLEQQETDRPTLQVYNWTNYIAPATLNRFTAQTGVRVNYRMYDTNDALTAVLLAGRADTDVVFPTAQPHAAEHIRDGMLHALDRSLLPNWEHLDPATLRGLADLDPGNQHLVPYLWGTTGLGYNVGKIEEILDADAPLDSWAMLFDPEISSRLRRCGIAVLDDETEGLGAALIYLGLPVASGEAADLEAATALWFRVRRNIRYFDSSRYLDELADGEICLALGYSGDVLQARQQAELRDTGNEITYVIPQEGAIRWVDTAAIPVDAPNPELAHAFINFLLEPAVIAEISNHVAYANANRAALALIRPELREDPAIYPGPELTEKLVSSIQPRAVDNRRRARAWQRIKAGR